MTAPWWLRSSGLALALVAVQPLPVRADSPGASFLPHAVCYLWDPSLLALHAITDLLIGTSYVAISATLGYLVYRARRDVPFHWVILAFGLFIVACGMTHFMELWTLWSARYWLSGSVKALTAIASVATALIVPPLVPRALSLIGAAKLSEQRKVNLERAHAELESLYERIQEVDRLKTQFFANVSHELRTPLSLILGPSEKLLAAATLSEPERRDLAVIQRNARLLLRHVNDLLDVSKLEAGKMGLAYAQLDVAALVRLTAGHFDVLARERGIDYRVETPRVLQAQVDPDKLQRVLLNLVSNAFKFTPDGGTIRCAVEGGSELTLTVEDSGPGVAPALREAIFDRFRQGDGGATRTVGGTGLGLAIAKDFAELHGGRIVVGDAVLGGAAFTVRVPLMAPPGSLVQVSEGLREHREIAELTVADLRAQPRTASRPASVAAVAAPLDAPHVLLVEDNADMARHLAETLADEYRVDVAADGLEGLRMAREQRPDLIVSDIMMPGMSGDALVAAVRARDELAGVPILLLTAKADDELRARLLREGAQDYVTKPVAMEELKARVGNLVAMKRAREVLQRELATQTGDVATLAREIAARTRQLQTAEAETREQREWLRVTLTSIGDAVMVADPAGRVTFMNPVAEAVTRWTGAAAAGRGLDEVFRIVNEQTRATVESPVARVIREGTIVGLANHTILIARDGAEVPIDDSGAPIRDEHGRLLGVVLVFRDVSERRDAERERQTLLDRERDARSAAEAASGRLAFLADASAVIASSLDFESTLMSVARLAVPSLGDWCAVDIVEDSGTYSRLAVVHVDPSKEKLARELQGPFTHGPGAVHGLAHVERTGQPEFHPEVGAALLAEVVPDPERRARLRELGFGSYMCIPLIAAGRVLGAITFVRGRADRRYGVDDLALGEALARRASLAIENARLFREAQIASRTKDEFLATLSHELRTPLNAMLGWASMLLSGTLDPPTSARALESIERNTRAQVQLIDDLLDVSRIISGKLRLHVRAVDLIPVIEAALEATRPAAEAKGIQLELALDAGAGPVPGDPDRLQQVFWNLLSNAIKFTPKGGRVRIRLERIDSRVRIRVADTGKGIAPEFLPYIFDRFRQAESPTTRTQGGLGLGLAIVRHLVDLHGGTVRADSAGEGQGSTFTLELPVRAAREAEADEQWAARAPGAAHRFEPPPILAGLKVLVVDDDRDARDLVSTILQQCRAVVTTVADTTSALRAAEREHFDLLVSDIGLPGEDGYALIRKLRALEVTRGGRLPAVALTAYARSDDRRLALLAGFQMHVSKPVQPAELVGVVASLATLMRNETS
jgi:PAS domain S-box-containing protein